MKSSVYIETSIVSYLTSPSSRDPITAGHKRTTVEWWELCRPDFRLVASELVVEEARLGNSIMAAKRLEVLKDMQILTVGRMARELAKELVFAKVVPEKASTDALHIAVAAVEGIEFLATWNFKHIANARMQGKIEKAIRSLGFEPSQICTLEELYGD